MCDQCPKTFTCKANLKLHVKTHDVGDNSMKCDYCESTFSSKSKLKHHTLKCMCVLPKQIREQKMVHIMMKVEQEGERLNKVLNEIENKLVQIKNKPTRYFQMIRDLENKILSDHTYFEKKSRSLKNVPGPGRLRTRCSSSARRWTYSTSGSRASLPASCAGDDGNDLDGDDDIDDDDIDGDDYIDGDDI